MVKTQTPRLHQKQKRFAEGVALHGNQTQAYIDAGYKVKSRKIAGSNAGRLMKNEGVKNEVQRLLVKSGLGEEAIIKKLKQAINSGLGEKATNSDSLRGIDMLAKMSKMYPNQKIEIDKKELKLSVEGKDSKELMGKLDRLLEQSKGMKETLTIEDGETIG